jgi:hypothetical protein
MVTLREGLGQNAMAAAGGPLISRLKESEWAHEAIDGEELFVETRRLAGPGPGRRDQSWLGGPSGGGQSGSITVRKAASAPVSTQFAFELQGPGVLEEFLLRTTESVTFDEVPAGTYVVGETLPEDWELAAISCGVFFAPGPVASCPCGKRALPAGRAGGEGGQRLGE